MNDRVNSCLLENFCKPGFVKQINLVKAQFFAAYFLNPPDCLFPAVYQAIHHGDIIACPKQFHAGMGTYIPCPTSNQYSHIFYSQEKSSC